MKGVKITLSDQQTQYLKENYSTTKNAILYEHLGISERTLVRTARKLGLRKDSQFMKDCLRHTIECARKWQAANAHPMPGFRIPGGEKYRFKHGESPEMRFGPEKFKIMIKKSQESRARTVKKERARILFGLPQKTRMKLVRSPRRRIYQRYYLKKLGYVIDEDSRTAFYDSSTKRALIMESRTENSYYKFQKQPNN